MDKKTNLIGYPVVIIITAILAFLVGKCQGPDVIVDQGLYPPDGSPEKLLSFDEVSQYYDNYSERALFIQRHVREKIADSSFISTRAVTFDYQELKNYLAFIEDNAESANIKISGLRFFYGKHSASGIKDKAHKQTLFYNPTSIFTIDGEEKELSYAIKRGGDKVSAVTLKEVIDSIRGTNPNQSPVKAKAINEASVLSFLSNSSTYDETESQAGNRGQLNPPPSDDM